MQCPGVHVGTCFCFMERELELDRPTVSSWHCKAAAHAVTVVRISLDGQIFLIIFVKKVNL